MASSVNQEEVARFAALADEWWSPKGPYAPLHKLTPVRVEYVRDRLAERFARDPSSLKSLKGLNILDVGCGGGILSEPLARLGASVTGIEPAAESIAVAKSHAEEAGLDINYRAASAEELLAEGRTFDAVIASEVIEHVDDPASFVKTISGLARPGGLVLFSTLNRTVKSFALAIVGAEYVLRWIPAGTHDWQKFVTPDELTSWCASAGVEATDVTGMIFDPLRDRWRLGRDSGCNYWLTAEK
ncbi:ubiquinone biosynthesis O-methyltransferase [Terrihabitans soli]|uniref:Ubiquinone biosynthesis O-methyltransferase n=1 Tax=Terrihabitans soli TaxID=708113 RepID=A0A6S6QLH4_9HYPH|nr:bifunctional 2-polyprenyl-6-hydroxyphenol methylase/3-demethylubiquinol 3-O-methyltransferase UbiG [Terrihabitans soli]BCJ89729.1 ubiquinone biosynthesis O-methyltransferase [Terrihabitans soli]